MGNKYYSYAILYKTILGRFKYVYDYETAKLNGNVILGGFKFTEDISKAKRIPTDISTDNLLDKSLCKSYVTALLPNIK